MESKRAQKLSKATVATVLAASGVIVAMPQPSHAYSFEDLNPLADYYEPVLDLANRKIATGYSNGTFKPNQAITREDAAKMLALTIDVNITNPKNPGFKDVSMSNPNYRYIAALAEAGIINGYSDKTFKPKEPITRGQMAKILTLGFKFGVSKKLNHGFKDVSSKNANAYFIQTLFDLNVTKGKTAIAYDPFNTVTRGQMATFIWRAEKADRGNPVYAVGDVIGDQIYINGVAHTIAPHLRSILSAANKNILKDAAIEGDFSGNRINNISKLTINASGTSSRLLAMDGDYSSFAGELVVNGSYVRFKNITFTGRVEVAEAPRRSLADLSNIRVASVGNVAQFIDWSKPTVEKNEDFLNPIDKENLVDKPDPTKPNRTYKDRMPNLKKYVDFEGSDVRHLYVTAERTFLKADYKIDRLYVHGNVSNFELFASPNAMYIDTDYNVNIYGAHDIRYVYKNTLKNVHLRSDATYDNYYITSSNGFTNIGEHAYITNAIIPPNKTVNDVFDDFKTDEPQIGHIEDTNGKPVSRDPVGDTVIKDVTAPRITDLRVSAGGTLADVSLTANEDGTFYYVVKRADEKAPTINEIKTGGTKHAGNGPIVMDEPAKFQVSGLDTKADYIIYAIVIDAADNVSEKESAEFSTIDNKPPTFTLTKGDVKPGGKRFEFIVKNISEPGRVYYYVRQKGSSAVDPTVDEIIKNPTGDKLVTTPRDLPVEVREIGAKPNMSAVLPSTEYEVFAVMVDSTGNKMRVVEKITIKTEAPDEAQPYVAGNAEMKMVDNEKGIFEFEVSEALDPVTGKDPKNYELSGTGVLNITGQKTMYPTKVEVNGKKVRLTIPALNALVKNDTIRVTVSKNVLDLAENEFENVDNYPSDQNAPRNEAYYTHKDDAIPKLTINKVIVEKDRNLVDFTATKAGTYYYMILESGYNFNAKNISSRDFVDEFETKNMNGNTKFGNAGSKVYTGNLLNQYGPAELNLNTKSINIDFGNLDPFKSYSVYMVLKDRAGLVANDIVEAPIVADSKAPLITGLTAKAKEGTNNSVDFSFTADEAGTLYVVPVKKYIYDTATSNYKLNEQYFNVDGTLKSFSHIYPTTSMEAQRAAFEALGASEKGTFSKGAATVNISGLEQHEEYGFYIAAEDNVGATKNFTIFERKDATDPAAPDEPNGSQMIKYAYTDGKAPEVENIVYKEFTPNRADTTLEITFSESILRQEGIINNSNNLNTDYNKSLFENTTNTTGLLSSILKITGEQNSSNNLVGDFEFVSYSVANSGKATLKIRTANSLTASQVLQISMIGSSGTAYDYRNIKSEVSNRFDLYDFGYYYFPSKSQINKITYAGIGTPITPGSGNQSKTLTIEINLSATLLGQYDSTKPEINLAQEYYYAVFDGAPSGSLTDDQLAERIINAVRSNQYVQNMQYADKVTLNNNTDKVGNKPLTIPSTNNAAFQRGHRVYLFTMDNFGNIVWAMDHSDASNTSQMNNNYIFIK